MCMIKDKGRLWRVLMSSYCVRFAATGLPGKSPPDFTCPFPLRGMGGEQCEMERGIHVFLAHPHLGGRAERDGRGHQCNGK